MTDVTWIIFPLHSPVWLGQCCPWRGRRRRSWQPRPSGSWSSSSFHPVTAAQAPRQTWPSKTPCQDPGEGRGGTLGFWCDQIPGCLVLDFFLCVKCFIFFRKQNLTTKFSKFPHKKDWSIKISLWTLIEISAPSGVDLDEGRFTSLGATRSYYYCYSIYG